MAELMVPVKSNSAAKWQREFRTGGGNVIEPDCSERSPWIWANARLMPRSWAPANWPPSIGIVGVE